MTSSASSAWTTEHRREIRVGLVDDHVLLSDALAQMLTTKGFVAVSVKPLEFDPILAVIEEQGLNVILLDLDLGAFGTSIRLIPPLRELGCQVIMLTGSTERATWGACIEAGASSVLSKEISFEELVSRVTELLDDVAERRQAERLELLDVLRRHRAEQGQRLAPFTQLTVREHQVLVALMDGMSADEIAASTYVSLATVRTHIRSILQKLGVNSQLAAVAMALRAGWTPSDHPS